MKKSNYLFVSALLLCILFWSVTVFRANPAQARVGGGSSYRSTQSEDKTPSSSGQVTREEKTRSYSGRDKDGESLETSDPDKKSIKLTKDDYDYFRWFGVFMTILLLGAGVAVAALLIFKSDRSSGSFLKDILLPAGSINIVLWLITWAITRSFSIPLFVIALGIAATGGLLVWDGIRSFSSRAGAATGKTKKEERIEKSNPAEIGKFDLLREDPAFSLILLTDFVHALYHEFMGRLGTDSFENLSPFFVSSLPNSHNYYRQNGVRVMEIVVGNIAVAGIKCEEKESVIELTIQANYTTSQDNTRSRFAVIENWTLARARGTQTPVPERMQTICCPNCGAPAHFSVSGKCAHCGTMVKNGLMQWYIRDKKSEKIEQYTTKEAVAYVNERGTNLPTITSPFLEKAIQQICETEQIERWDEFWGYFSETIVRQTCEALYNAWSTMSWDKARHLLTDRMYSVNNGWIEFYRNNKFINKLDDFQVSSIILAKISTDLYYQAITVRIFASCFDYVIDERSKVVGGSRKKRRDFSEYWTFVRRVDASKKAAEYNDISACPACGSPADKISDTAQCGYCGSKISSGSFSWVLALITQDEVYEG